MFTLSLSLATLAILIPVAALAIQFDVPKGAQAPALDSLQEARAVISQTLGRASQVARAAFSDSVERVDESTAAIAAHISASARSIWSNIANALSDSLRTVADAIPGTTVAYSRSSMSQSASASLALAGQNAGQTNVPSGTTQSTVTTGTTTIINNYITNPVIERVVQGAKAEGTSGAGTAGYVTESTFLSKLNELSDRFGKLIYGTTYPAPATNYGSGGILSSVALSNRIDNLSKVTISSLTVSGVTGLSDADIPDGITASNYLALTGGTISGNLTVTGSQTLSGAITIPYLSATSSTASSFVQASSTRFSVFDKAYFGGSATSTFDSSGNLSVAGTLGVTGATTLGNFTATNSTTTNATSTNFFATNASTTNATSTNLFATLGRFTNSIVDTLLTAVSATITNLTATTLTATNATTTQLDAYNYVAVGRTATTTIRGDGTASTIPFASSTALTVSGTGYFGTASTSALTLSGFAQNRIPYLGAAGTVTSSGNLTFDGSALALTGAQTISSTLGVTGLSTLAGLISTASSTIGSGTQAGGLTISGGATTTGFLAITGTSGTTTIASGQGFTIGGSQFVLQQGSGNVGIGTTTPNTPLNVRGTTGVARFEGTGNTAGIFLSPSGQKEWRLAAGDSNVGDFGIRNNTDSLVALSITSGGNVGIGTTSPDTLLTVSAVSNGSYVQRWRTPSNTTFLYQDASLTQFGPSTSQSLQLVTSNLTRLTIDSNGDVSLAGDLRVSGDAVSFPGIGANAGTHYVCISSASSPTWAITVASSCGASDERLKTNVLDLSTEEGLAAILRLRPIAFDWKDTSLQSTDGPQIGLIAQDVQQVLPDLVSINGTSTITLESGTTETVPNTLSVDYPKLVVPLIKAVQEIGNLASTFKDRLVAWFADAANGIGDFFAHRLIGDQLCARRSDDTLECVTGDQLAALLAAGASPAAPPSPAADIENQDASSADTSFDSAQDEEAPIITINGNDPATISVGDSYADLGATVEDNVDQNLGIKTFVDGVEVQSVSIDTSVAGEHTIRYEATDNAGNTGSAERIVIVEVPESADQPPADEHPTDE